MENASTSDGQEYTLQVPETLKSFVSIEMPCFASTSTAMKMMGNQAVVHNAIVQQAQEIQLHFRPDDPLSHPIVGKPHEASGLLLKVRRKRSNPSESQVQVVGKIFKSYRFRSLADFQFLPSSTRVNGETVVDSSQTTLETPPAVFARTTAPPNVFKPMKAVQANKVRRKDRTTIIKFGDPIPQEPKKDQTRRRQTRKYQATQQALQQIFQSRPIWQRKLIELAPILEDKMNMMAECLQFFAFTFSSGPWVRTWCRYNYDPARHRDASIYQSINVRFQMRALRDWCEAIYTAVMAAVTGGESVMIPAGLTVKAMEADLDNNRVVLSTNSTSDLLRDELIAGICKLNLFGYELKQQVAYQLCEIPDDDVLAYVSDIQLQPRCSAKSGWFSDSSLDEIRKRIVQSAQSRVKRLLQSLSNGAHDVITMASSNAEQLHLKGTDRDRVWFEDMMRLPQRYASTIAGGGYDVSGGSEATAVSEPLLTSEEVVGPRKKATTQESNRSRAPKRAKVSASDGSVLDLPSASTVQQVDENVVTEQSQRFLPPSQQNDIVPFEVFDENGSDSAYSGESDEEEYESDSSG